jgi:hypothetical protein
MDENEVTGPGPSTTAATARGRVLLAGDLERVFFGPEEGTGRQQPGAEKDQTKLATHAGHGDRLVGTKRE